jgi:hypothetical protein
MQSPHVHSLPDAATGKGRKPTVSHSGHCANGELLGLAIYLGAKAPIGYRSEIALVVSLA